MSYKKIPLSYFWRTFEEILLEKGEPFKIIHEKGGEQTFWACINRNKALVNNSVDISLVQSKNFLRVGLYVLDKTSNLGVRLIRNRKYIDDELTFIPKWESGERNSNTLRITAKFPIDNNTSRELIEKAFPYIMQFFAIAKKYGKYEFFDFD